VAPVIDDDEQARIERRIERVLTRYAHAVDARDYDAVAACYWPDAHDEHADFSGDAVAYVAWLRAVLPPITTLTHQFTNVLIEVQSPVHATSTAYCTNTLVFAGAPGEPATHTTSCLRYHDRFEQREGEWRIADRRVQTDWFRVESPRSTDRIAPGSPGAPASPDA
jgi:ketosteroid isomerase-like protein